VGACPRQAACPADSGTNFALFWVDVTGIRRAGSPAGWQRISVCPQKTKQGACPALKFSFLPVASGHLFFVLEWLRLIAPPVFPPSDLDHTR
jgi:hypothetical protein